jgi:tetraacyldisaccharide 4'-kinase
MRKSAGPMSGVLAPLGFLAARLYHVGWSVDVRRQLRGGAAQVDVPVISVGNLTVGGTGKSPFCSHLAERLHSAGARPAVAMRGYRASRTGGSDEAEEYRRRHPWLPVLVGADRAKTIRDSLQDEVTSPDVVLLDDGFQHRRLHRDLDIVLVDALRPGIDGDLLPRGWLREPARSLARADLVILTRADGNHEAAHELVRRFRGAPPDASCRHAWERIDVHEGGVDREAVKTEDCAGRNVVLCTGLGNPSGVVRQVEAAGMKITKHLAFPDHAHYGPREIDALCRAAAEADCIFTTAKDWVKLSGSSKVRDLKTPILVPRVSIAFLDGAEEVARKIQLACGVAPVL